MASPKFFSSPRFSKSLKTNFSPFSNGYCISKNTYNMSVKYKLHGHFHTPQKEQLHFPHLTCNDIPVDTPDRAELVQNGLNLTKINKILGRGSYGTVVPGKYKGQAIAVKLISREKHPISLLNERNAAKLSHPNIVKILKVVSGEGSYDLVLMEKNFGYNLQELLLDSLFFWNIEKKLKCALNVAHALDYCHSSDILHLDVKPKNILFCLSNGTCKLCDFGSSIKLDELDKILDRKPNLGMNTVCYTAPELFKGGKPSKKADVYSFSITLCQLLLQSTPYKGMDCHTIIYKVVANEFRPDCEQPNHEVEMDCLQLCRDCWKSNPSDRPNMVEVIQELNRIQTCLNI